MDDEDEDSHNLAQAAEMVFDRGAGLTNSCKVYEALDVLSSSAYDVKNHFTILAFCVQ
jgi:hypothetical protein